MESGAQLSSKEIVTHFNRYGLNVRPKAVQIIQKRLKTIQDEFSNQISESDEENEFRIDVQKFLDLVVSKFNTIKSLGGESSVKFLDKDEVDAIFAHTSVEEL